MLFVVALVVIVAECVLSTSRPVLVIINDCDVRPAVEGVSCSSGCSFNMHTRSTFILTNCKSTGITIRVAVLSEPYGDCGFV